MGDRQEKGAMDRSAASDVWRRTLAQIPSIFGRLVYLSSLRNLNTGVYEHHGLAQRFGDQQATDALRSSHEQSFAAWLNSSLAEQKADLDLYLSALTSERRPVVETWLRVSPYRGLVPASARTSERDLFARDFHELLEALRREYGLPVTDPEE